MHKNQDDSGMLLFSCIFTITLSSFLLFFIQPLAAKELLPLFGGVPAVWNICMAFFQGILLLGYLYAYINTRYLTAYLQRTVHFALIAFSLLMLPILWEGLHPRIGSDPAVNVMWLLVSKLTLPLFILSATASLMQYWFGQTNHPHAKDPYFLYSASNVGGLVALLGFPFLFEPFFGIRDLSIYWSAAYGVFVLGLVAAVLQCAKAVSSKSVTVLTTGAAKISSWQRVEWLLLSFAPSSLLMGVTQYITTDIVATPLFWILPLTLYLLTFIIAFARKPIISHAWMVREQAFFLIFPLIAMGKNSVATNTFELILFPLLGFFVLTMVCQGELVAKRPEKSHLTEFYLWIALGGFLGSVFNSFVAPLIFNGIYEYYIAFCLCILLRPWPTVNGKYQWQKSDFFLPLSIALVLLAAYFLYALLQQISFYKWIDIFIELAVITVIVIWHQRPFRFAACLAVLFLYAQMMPATYGHLLWQSRDFFGVTRVYKNDVLNLHILLSGSTMHGLQLANDPENFTGSLSYYQPVKAIADLIEKGNAPQQVAIAGLGSGTLSCLFQKEAVTFFEIDPAMIKVAETPAFFTYLKYCPPRGGVVLGDARLSMMAEAQHKFNIIIIDVFSSDSIPVHLITEEAVALYFQKISPGGLLIFHISSRHINFNAVLATIAARLHLEAYSNDAMPLKDENQHFQFMSDWVVLTSNAVLTKKLGNELHWKKLAVTKKPLVWTDDFSNILRVLK
jgi:spermidine synthase